MNKNKQTDATFKGQQNSNFLNKASSSMMEAGDHKEGKVTKGIENQTAKIPSGVYLALAVGSMALSAGLALSSEHKEMANFVGLWAPSFVFLSETIKS